MKQRISTLLSLVIIGMSIIAVAPFHTASAPPQLKGLVCIDPAIAQTVAPTGCSSAPVILGGTQYTVGSKFTLEVDLAVSDITNGFDVAVVTDTSILNPLSINTTGTGTLINAIGGSPFPLTNCVNNGVGGSAVSCVPGVDGSGVAHLSTVALGGLSSAPTTGRLVFVNYQVTGLSSDSLISFVVTTPQGTGACAGSSNSTAAGDTCVFIANGGGGFDPEDIQTATFFNVNDFAIAANPQTIRVAPGGSDTSTITLTSLGAFAGTVDLSKTVTPTGSSSPTATFNTTSVILTAGGTKYAQLTVATVVSTPVGTYSVNVTGISSPLGHSVIVTVVVGAPDFSINPTPSTLIVLQGKNNQTIILLSSINTFNGTITLSHSSAPAGATLSFNTTTVKLTSGITNSSLLTVNTSSSTAVGSYPITITGTNATGSLAHSATLTLDVVVPDFTITASPQVLPAIDKGQATSSTIRLVGLYTFNGTITLTANQTTDITTSLSTSPIVLSKTTTTGTSTLNIVTSATAAPGTYTIRVVGTNSTGSPIHDVNLTLVISAPDFSLVSTTSLTIQAGNTRNSSVNITSLHTFTGTIDFAINSTVTGLTPSFNPTSLTLSTSGSTATTTLTISVTATATPATYTLILNGTSGNLLNQVRITVTVTAPLPQIQLGTPSLSTATVTVGSAVKLTVTITNTGNVNANITVAMDVNKGNANVTVAQSNMVLKSGQSKTVTLDWDTTDYASGYYNVYARVIGVSSNNVNQASSPLTVTVNSAPPNQGFTLPGGNTLWIIIIAAAAIIVAGSLYVLRRKSHPMQSV